MPLCRIEYIVILDIEVANSSGVVGTGLSDQGFLMKTILANSLP